MPLTLLGMSEEDRLAFEQANGIKTEAAKLIYEESVQEAEARMRAALREVQEVIGPHGSISRVQVGGVRITPGSGIGVFQDGVLKTNVQSNGTLVIGSDISDPTTTTEVFFVEDSVYNAEEFGAGDFLIGNNSSGESNIKFDASSGQLQFRYGTTIKAYMDTDGSLKAGSGDVTLDETGIKIVEGLDEKNSITFVDENGATLSTIQQHPTNTALVVSPAGNFEVAAPIYATDGSNSLVGMFERASAPSYVANYAQLFYLNTGIFKLRHKQDATEIESTLSNASGGMDIPSGADYNLNGKPVAWYMIEDKNLGADTASFDFQSIPATFKQLKIVLEARSDRASNNSDGVKIRFNNDTGNNYLGYIQWNGGSTEQATAGAPTNCTFVTAATSPANYFSNDEILIADYANTNKNKTWQARGMQIATNSAGNLFIYDGMGMWLSTAAINRVTLVPNLGSNFKQYSRATLYGLK